MRHAGVFIAMAFLLASCSRNNANDAGENPVRSYLEGRFTLSAAVDSVPDYSGFEVLVVSNDGEQVDTLGIALTDSTGAFQLDIEAPDRGLYPLFVSRGGGVLSVDELAVADGDSATVQAEYPLTNRSLRIRSVENAAWAAYRNTKAQHNSRLVELLRNGQYHDETVRRSVAQTTMIFWSMRNTFPHTIGAELASAEAVMMMSDWDDSLAVAWALDISPDNANYAGVTRAARQAQARLAGQAAALQLVRDFQDKATDDDLRAQVQTELILAYVDSSQHDEALAAARSLADTYPSSPWADWADRAIYELETLLPGMQAPAFSATTQEGDSIALDSLRGWLVLLEFYMPQDQVFQRELSERIALREAAGDEALTILSISVEPDTLLNEAFLDGRDVPGTHVFAPDGLENELARSYNVNVVPTRYLIDRDGAIVAKYVGSAMTDVRRDILALLQQGV